MKQHTYTALENAILFSLAGLAVGALNTFRSNDREYEIVQIDRNRVEVREYKFQDDEEPSRTMQTGFIGHGVWHTVEKIKAWIADR